jgi:hypothetical protein
MDLRTEIRQINSIHRLSFQYATRDDLGIHRRICEDFSWQVVQHECNLSKISICKDFLGRMLSKILDLNYDIFQISNVCSPVKIFITTHIVK